MHSQDSSTKDCWIVFRFRETSWDLVRTTRTESRVFFKHSPLHFDHLWDSTWAFFDLYYCSGAISTRLHMSLIDLISSGNSLDVWARHCCLLPLLLCLTLSTAYVSFGNIYTICLWKLSQNGPYELDFGIWTMCFPWNDELFAQTTDKHCHLFLCMSNQNKIACHWRPTSDVADKAVSSLKPVREGPLHFLTGGPPTDRPLFFFHCLNIFKGVPCNNPEKSAHYLRRAIVSSCWFNHVWTEQLLDFRIVWRHLLADSAVVSMDEVSWS